TANPAAFAVTVTEFGMMPKAVGVPSTDAVSQLLPLSVVTCIETGPPKKPAGGKIPELRLFGFKKRGVISVCPRGVVVTVSATGITTGSTTGWKIVATGVIV